MNSLHRLAAIGALSLAASAGCGVNEPLPQGSTSAPLSKARVGSFSGYYHGNLAITFCSAKKNGQLTFQGEGHATHLHGSSESGALTGVQSGSICFWSGMATLTSRQNPGDSITFSLQMAGKGRRQNPCTAIMGYGVKSGTGRFANASGRGDLTITCTKYKTYTDGWSGRLKL
ncbi:MAG: hypothetical protein WB609_01085 [Candidatus Cybelea sp.]